MVAISDTSSQNLLQPCKKKKNQKNKQKKTKQKKKKNAWDTFSVSKSFCETVVSKWYCRDWAFSMDPWMLLKNEIWN